MSFAAKLLSLTAIILACAAALLALASGDALVLIAWIVIGLAAILAVGLIVFFDLVIRATRQVFGRAPTSSGEESGPSGPP